MFLDSSGFGQMISSQRLNCATSLELLGQATCSSSEPNKKKPDKPPGPQTTGLPAEGEGREQ